MLDGDEEAEEGTLDSEPIADDGTRLLLTDEAIVLAVETIAEDGAMVLAEEATADGAVLDDDEEVVEW